jgi:NADH-quinone oxidoreductase subunit L
MFLCLGLFGKHLGTKLSGLLGTVGMSIVTVLAYYTAFQYFSGSIEGAKAGDEFLKVVVCNYEWLSFASIGAPNLIINLGVLLDPISAMMLVVITTVSLMVHIYSLGYMHGESGFQRYYAVLSLFSFAMLGLVVATNIFQMYIFWELVGVSSFLLISFYFTKPSAVRAAKKAFIVTRFADMFFLIGILILSYYTKTFDFEAITANNAALVSTSFAGATFMGLSVASIATMLIFMGGAGKSAMFPFHIWLPDAMEGPTPASALIHAATMVVAGVFLVARLFPVYSFVTPDVLETIAYIGAFTSLFAAVIACTQTDIKRVLAFSTISQIAYMLVALGVSGFGNGHDGLGFTSSMWHLFTHAMFKALLFLGAGAIIHAVHSNEMGAMGNLRKHLPITHATFAIACLAIAGIWPLSGFFSKDEILVAALHSNKIIFMCQELVAGLTAFYMFRLYYRIFWYNKKDYGHHQPHEAPASMFIPLIVLAVFTVVGGFIPFSKYITSDGIPFEIHTDWFVAILSSVAAISGILIATVLYMKQNARPDAIVKSIKHLYTYAHHKFYIDEIYLFITNKIIFDRISKPIAWFDRHIIDGFMNLTAWVTQKTSFEIRDFQSGNVQQYAWVFVMGVVGVVAFVIYL